MAQKPAVPAERRLVRVVLLATTSVATAGATNPPPPFVARARTSPPTGRAFGYLGGCSFQVEYQATATGTSWVGTVDVVIVSTYAGIPHAEPISGVRCTLKTNGVPQGPVLTAPAATGATANTGRLEYQASPTDVVTLCTEVSILGSMTSCADAEVSSVPWLSAASGSQA